MHAPHPRGSQQTMDRRRSSVRMLANNGRIACRRRDRALRETTDCRRERGSHQLFKAKAPAAKPSTMATSRTRNAADFQPFFSQHSSGMACRKSVSVNGGAADRSVLPCKPDPLSASGRRSRPATQAAQSRNSLQSVPHCFMSGQRHAWAGPRRREREK